jgi:hypothetical protein
MFADKFSKPAIAFGHPLIYISVLSVQLGFVGLALSASPENCGPGFDDGNEGLSSILLYLPKRDLCGLRRQLSPDNELSGSTSPDR